MHTVIGNAWAGDPYHDRHAVHVHGQHGLELVDEHRRDASRMLTDKDGDRRIQASRTSSTPMPIYSEMVAYADLVLPDTTYLERWDCISLLDRPIGMPHGAGRCDPPAGGRARPRRAAVPGRADRTRRAARPARLRQGGRHGRAIQATMPTTSSTTSARRASARWPAGAARTARTKGAASPTRTSCSATSRMAASGATTLPPRAALFQARQPGLSRLRRAHGLDRASRADRPAALFGAAAEVPPRRRGPWRVAAAGPASRAHPHLFRSAAHLVRAVRGGGAGPRALSAARRHPAADGDVPFLGLA